jgi:hypothetical protein
VVEVPPIARDLLQRKDPAEYAVPLFDIPPPMLSEGNTQRMKEGCGCAVQAITQGQTKGEGVAALQVQLPGQGHIAFQGEVELPVHLEVVGQVCPAITSPHVTAGQAAKRDSSRQCQPDTPLYV